MRGRYIGPDLAALFEPELAKRAAHRITDAAGDAMHDHAVQNTPIRTGNLRSAWYRERTKIEPSPFGAADMYSSRIANDVSYAGFVNYGTGLWGPQKRKYLIVPKVPGGLLSWINPLTGRRVFARHVWHPGSPGQFMVENAAAKTEATLGSIAEPHLEAFKREQEAIMSAVAKAVY